VDPDFLSLAQAIEAANGTTLALHSFTLQKLSLPAFVLGTHSIQIRETKDTSMIAIQKQDEHTVENRNAELLRILSRTRRRPTDAEKFEVRKQLLLKIIESLVSDSKRS
jgi:hypothetical protein